MAKDTDEKKKPWFDKKNIITIVFLSISLSFTVFFFSPIDIFLGNQIEFLINAYYIIIPMLISAFVGSLILILIGLLLLKNKTVYNIVINLLFGLLLAFYIQMIFFNGDMQIMNDTDVMYSEPTLGHILNFLIIYAVFFSPVVLSAKMKKTDSDSGIINLAKGKVISYVSALIFAMQLVGNIGMFASTGLLKTDNDQYIYGFSFEPVMSLSKEKNITVFLFDELDGNWLDTALEKYPEMNERLEGFTYYQNNISRYNYTHPSVCYMLTNTEKRENISKTDYINSAWETNSLTGILNENGYRINLILDQVSTISNFSQIPECSNILPTKMSDYGIDFMGKHGIVRTMTGLSVAKLTPYYLKEFFLLSAGGSGDKNFLIPNSELPFGMVYTSGTQTDRIFNKYLNENSMNSDSEQKTFSFIHMYGAHVVSADISNQDPALSVTEENADIYSTIRGNFETLFTYCDMMKELGIYDNSTIIIVADHAVNEDLSPAALLIKPENAESEPLKYDTEAELSNANFFPGVLDFADIEHSEYGYYYNDIIYGDLHPDRYITMLEIGKGTRYYLVNGDARDRSNWAEQPADTYR